MEDDAIVRLYHARSENAISETAAKYGGFCMSIALNILSLREDAEECVNDTYHAAWLRMPPELPDSLRAFLGRITRNISISRFRRNRAAKRFSGIELMLSELEECIPDKTCVEQAADCDRLTEVINRWLDALPEDDRTLFVRRYWYGDAVNGIAQRLGCAPNRVSQRLFGLRRDLKNVLEKEDFLI